ncbi:2-succinyl-5-enolpyruvyl-6-hydroxy-3-cyclohexene-1-carboxylic-acid synthase [Bacillus sp. PS06]|uniref:2-succinyl-5-enolpyruvyl-6-hydroxy-3- cyclohexene-1-carboxylic-acid synthase n=1 Tax=Bacillus sp. PS06 TaxID=2764176 RepID=UPI001781E928|nr:2-succinyl-5-enolpyruvyl-6-hydroxy-3-cyclohexene-1-carboxylic-acid synthase [Bacillus sp. PS06]MBD8068549.1 2-succinyl-5-enolpyruvyl-6-hydroxy-3-cyclohexene-1-carboxylic-acid synthase [Bacillus sp. PS06]
MKTTDKLTNYIGAFVDELVRVGVENVVISPGSRSTPIAILMAEHDEMKTYMNIDERSAAFFALGMAKSQQKPVALLCTSGTAAANYYPAIVEAHYSRIPLIVITADRPHELRDVGAPQAIDQTHLYGKHVKWFVDLALPEETNEMNRYVRTVAARAAGKAMSAPAGPVHLNVPLREPLVPNLTLPDLFTQGRKLHNKQVNVVLGTSELEETQLSEIVAVLEMRKKGIIICGELYDDEFAHSVTMLAEKLQFPILADPLSQLRSGTHSKEMIIDSYDAFLRNQEFTTAFVPEIIIRFGAMPVSKALLLYLKKHPDVLQFVIDGDGGWREPTLLADEMIFCQETSFCQTLVNHLPEKAATKWSTSWLEINQLTKKHLGERVEEHSLFEGRVIQELQFALPEHSLMFVGNSMPIRDLDSFFITTEKDIQLMANRGANGIDGVVSSAIGASTSGRNTVLVIGDLSFYHDLNGLLAAKLNELDLTVILINNDGGGIFSFLPQSREEKHFEYLFGTPSGIEFEHAINMYNGHYMNPESWAGFTEAVEKSIHSKGLSVIELKTNRLENVGYHQNLWNRVSQEINDYLTKGH